MQQDFLALPNFVVLVLIFLAICWYSWETRKLRNITANMAQATRDQAEATRTQVEAMQQPCIGVKTSAPCIHVVNVGLGPAFRIHVSIVEAGTEQSSGNQIPHLALGEECKFRLPLWPAKCTVLMSYRSMSGAFWAACIEVDVEGRGIQPLVYERITKDQEITLDGVNILPYTRV